MSSSSDTTTPKTMPATTPTKNRPIAVATNTTKSRLLVAENRATTLKWISPRAASMTTAPSTAWGRFENIPARNRSVRTVSPATVRPASWVFWPELSLTAVLLRLPHPGKPPTRDEPTQAAPCAMSSWSGENSCLCLAAVSVAVAIDSL